MGKARQTFERRQLGLELRRHRRESDKSQQAAADHIGKSRSRIAELEDGRTTLTPEELANLLDFYEVTGEDRNTVLELGVQAKTRQKKRAHLDLLPGSFQRLADLEASAIEISCYEPNIIPGLLQSPGYIRAEITDTDGVWWEPSIAEMHDRITFRTRRQVAILDATEAKTLRLVVTETALRATVGAPEIMREQRGHILELLEGKRNLSVGVLLDETLGNPARAGGFMVFGFGDRAAPVGFAPVVFGPSTYFNNESDIAALRRAFDRLQKLALSPEESVRFIRKIDEER